MRLNETYHSQWCLILDRYWSLGASDIKQHFPADIAMIYYMICNHGHKFLLREITPRMLDNNNHNLVFHVTKCAVQSSHVISEILWRCAFLAMSFQHHGTSSPTMSMASRQPLWMTHLTQWDHNLVLHRWCLPTIQGPFFPQSHLAEVHVACPSKNMRKTN